MGVLSVIKFVLHCWIANKAANRYCYCLVHRHPVICLTTIRKFEEDKTNLFLIYMLKSDKNLFKIGKRKEMTFVSRELLIEDGKLTW